MHPYDNLIEPLSDIAMSSMVNIFAAILALMLAYVWLWAWSGPVVCSRCESYVRRKLGIPPETPSGGLCRECRRWYRDNMERILREARDDT